MAAAGKQLLRAGITRCCFLHEVSQWSPFKWNTDRLLTSPQRGSVLPFLKHAELSPTPGCLLSNLGWWNSPPPTIVHSPRALLTSHRLPKAFLDHATRRDHPGSLFQYFTASCITYSQLSYMSSCFCFSPTTASPKTKRDPVGAQ